MKIHEYQAKQILAKYGVPVPAGEAVMHAAEAKGVAERLGGADWTEDRDACADQPFRVLGEKRSPSSSLGGARAAALVADE